MALDTTPSFLRSQHLPAPEELKPSSPLLALQNKKQKAESLAFGDILDDSYFAESNLEMSMSSYPEWCHPGPAFDEQLKLTESQDPETIFGKFEPVNINDLLQQPDRVIRASPPPVIKPYTPLPIYSNFPMCHFRLDDLRGVPFRKSTQVNKPTSNIVRPRFLPPTGNKLVPQKSSVIQKPTFASQAKSTIKPTFRPNQARHM